MQLLKNNFASGLFAEKLARIYLFFHGYKIVTFRYKVGRGLPAGEIDIIATRGNTLIFVEVKKRATISLAKESIFTIQQQRIYYSAEVFLSQNPKYINYNCRFDAMCFNKYYFFEYIKNAWIG